MVCRLAFVLAAAGAALLPAAASSQTVPSLRYRAGTTLPNAVLSADACRRLLAAALAEAERNQFAMAIAIVDNSGNLIAFQRMDKTSIGAATVAQAKARTAAQFRMPTRAIGEMVNRIGLNMLTTPDMLSLGGGVPVVVEGVIVGAVGASGGTGEQDLQVIAAGMKALEE